MTPIRAMALADVDPVLAITAASHDAAPWNRAAYEGMLQDPQRACCTVAERDGVVVAFACFRVAGDEAELLNLAVLPACRRQGIGSRLLEQTLEDASKRGAARIFLEVRETNREALRFYQRYGFAVVMRRPGYYSNAPRDALVLARDLA